MKNNIRKIQINKSKACANALKTLIINKKNMSCIFRMKDCSINLKKTEF